MYYRAFALITIFALIVSSPFTIAMAGRNQQPPLVEDVKIRGNRRIPAETVRQYIQTKKGDPFDPAVIDKEIYPAHRRVNLCCYRYGARNRRAAEWRCYC